MKRRAIYLDHNASHPLKSGVSDAMVMAATAEGNASSVHGPGRAQHARLEDARDAIRQLVGNVAAQVVFTSGATEANNLALHAQPFRRVLVSAVEHPSVMNARGEAEVIPVTVHGIVDIEALDSMLAEHVSQSDGLVLVSVMLANNETGVIQPIAKVAEIAKRHGALVHCDAVQGFGRMTVSLDDLGVDMLSLSGHKFGAPQGVGALIMRAGLELDSAIKGGGQERGLRAGTENLPGIAGMLAAVSALGDVEGYRTHTQALRDALEDKVKDLAPEVTIFGEEVERLPNTSCFALPGLSAETQVMALDLGGVAISAGSACSSGKVTASPVIKAMGFGDDHAASAIRVSFGAGNAPSDLDNFLELWSPLVEGWRRQNITLAGTAA